ncbi:MAG: DNA polymerase III subunit chi [Gammaproteobacteria bacterium]|nr:DNA polymerase III subunit chi [Gammaproteobacteria bacterium]MBU1655080.1 DNA polymerase III subunit chi [Gammaproteobacteria bacterium]MBU1961552.1 DNA polymerase III subunit chi [Gammaproteobacteria bacterium]
MTRIDFYVLREGAEGDRYSLSCRLVEKACQQGHRVFIHVASEEVALHMDRLLWTFRQGSFIPHGLLHRVDRALTPVLISHQGDPGEEQDVLVNLSDQVPAFFSRFERMLEPLDRTPDALAAGRERFRFYRERGYPIEHHDI